MTRALKEVLMSLLTFRRAKPALQTGGDFIARASIGGEVEVRYLRQNEILTARVRPIAQPQRAA